MSESCALSDGVKRQDPRIGTSNLISNHAQNDLKSADVQMKMIEMRNYTKRNLIEAQVGAVFSGSLEIGY